MKMQAVPTENPQAATKQRRKQRRQSANLTGCSCGFLALMFGVGVMNLTEKLILPIIIASLIVLPVCTVLVRRTGKCRPLLYAARAAAVLLLVLPFFMTVLCLSFPKTPALYRIRRYIYREGVADRYHSGVLMPEHLPDSFTRYEFHARVQAPAQDYSPDASLRLHTDAEWLHQYEASLAAEEGLFRYENTETEYEEYDSEDSAAPSEKEHQCPKYLPPYLFDQKYFTESLENAVFYLPQDENGKPKYYAGAMINYETGLLVVWI